MFPNPRLLYLAARISRILTYTKEARKADFQGVVVVEAVIELDGRLSNLKIIKSPGLGLDQKVLETLAKWKCKPATRDGRPVRTSVPIEIGFRSR